MAVYSQNLLSFRYNGNDLVTISELLKNKELSEFFILSDNSFLFIHFLSIGTGFIIPIFYRYTTYGIELKQKIIFKYVPFRHVRRMYLMKRILPDIKAMGVS